MRVFGCLIFVGEAPKHVVGKVFLLELGVYDMCRRECPGVPLAFGCRETPSGWQDGRSQMGRTEGSDKGEVDEKRVER